MDWTAFIEPILNIGSSAYKFGQGNRSNSALLNAMREAEDRNYADTLAYNQAAQDFNNRAASVSNANSRAAAAASAANQRNALAAANKAWKGLDKVYGQNIALYKPFADTAATLLPKMSEAYQSGLGGYNMLSAYLNKPENMSKLGLNPSVWNSGAPVPEWAKKKKE